MFLTDKDGRARFAVPLGTSQVGVRVGVQGAAGWSYREEAKHFLARIRDGQPFASSAEDTLHDVRLFEDIYKRFLGK